ncbi:hypothetical protein Bbelb_064490 [Branchiostoma belcheri]|nr:hypothetical protein Bbelb_064490 [Branchiostoma belcheri]
MYEQAEPVRTPQAGSGRERNVRPRAPYPDPPDRRGNTSGHVGRGKLSCHKYQEEEDTSSNVYEKAETVKLENIPRDEPYGADTSTDADPGPPDGARVKGRRVCCIATALAVVATLAIVGITVLIFINETYNQQEDTIPTTVDALNQEPGQNQTGAIENAQCPLLSPPLNGFMTGSNSYGDVVNFTCEPGYILVGTSSLTCLSDGTWNGNLPTCTAVQCPLLSPPLNGFMTGSNSYGDVVNFTCEPGYNLVGTSSLTCLSDGTWDGNLPTCTAAQCPPLSNPLNGFVSGSNSYGDVVHFTCEKGYRLVGESSLTCLSDGTWNGQPATCTAVPFSAVPNGGHRLALLRCHSCLKTMYDGDMETAFACEGGTVQLSCSGRKTLLIVAANYGHTSASHPCFCGSNFCTNCRSHNGLAVAIVRAACQGNRQCRVTASNVIFGDSCHGVGKYLEVLYRCITESNVALGKTASSSSSPARWGPEKAVDGSRGTSVSRGDECTHTDNVYQPWWKVDLADIYTVNRVSVLNRGDCCGERLRNFMVRIGLNEDFTRNDQCGETYTGTPHNGATVVVYCDQPMTGRYVSIQLIGRSDNLQLCEVDVFAEIGKKEV